MDPSEVAHSREWATYGKWEGGGGVCDTIEVGGSLVKSSVRQWLPRPKAFLQPPKASCAGRLPQAQLRPRMLKRPSYAYGRLSAQR